MNERIFHGVDRWQVRPATDKPVTWVGSAMPANARKGDSWVSREPAPWDAEVSIFQDIRTVDTFTLAAAEAEATPLPLPKGRFENLDLE